MKLTYLDDKDRVVKGMKCLDVNNVGSDCTLSEVTKQSSALVRAGATGAWVPVKIE